MNKKTTHLKHYPKRLLQTAAVHGMEVPLPVLQAVAALPEAALHTALAQLQAAEFLYETRLFPERAYTFKHALTQQVAYQSLLTSTRQQVHQQIAQVFETHFAETALTQPELLAHHYTEAGCPEPAVAYWQKAGQRAVERSAHAEAISHLTKGLEVLKTLPDTRTRAQQELVLQNTLGPVLMAIRGWAAPEVEATYARARELCQQVGDTPQLFPALLGIGTFYLASGKLQTARELREQLLSLAQRQQEPALLLHAHLALGADLLWLGELAQARVHLEQGIRLYDQNPSHSPSFAGDDPGVCGRRLVALALSLLGYPEQALRRRREALTLAQELSHPFSLAFVLFQAAILHQFRREVQATRECAEAVMTLSTEQGFLRSLALGTVLRGWALAAQGQGEEGDSPDTPGLGHLAGHRARAGTGVSSCPAGRDVWESGAGRSRAEGDSRGAGADRQNRRAPPGSGAVSAPGRAPAGAGKCKATSAGGGGVFSPGPRRGPSTGGQVVGATGGAEPEPAMAAAGQACRSAGVARTDLQLVHRGV
jgi:tetratricopeptide (TPR) repeat protein